MNFKYINLPLTGALFHAMLSLALFSCSTDREDVQISGKEQKSGLSLKKVVIALKANKNPEKMLAEKETLQNYLSSRFERDVEILIPTDSSVVVESFRNGTLDVGYLSSTDAARNLDQETASVLLVHLKNELPNYQSIWLSLKEKKYQSLCHAFCAGT